MRIRIACRFSPARLLELGSLTRWLSTASRAWMRSHRSARRSVVEVRDGRTTEWTIDPAEFGYRDLTADALAGGDPADNARIIIEILDPSRRSQIAAPAAPQWC